MAEYTDNYGLIEPTYAELADIDPLNGNFETIDEIMHASQVSLADAYDLTATYNTGDVVMYQYYMYKCKEDGVTGAWDATKWERTTAGANGSGGGGTEVVANPVGTPTADLQTIAIAGTIYDIPGGGGSGGDGGGVKIDTIWQGSANQTGVNYTINKSIEEYDYLIFKFRPTDVMSGTDETEPFIRDVKDLTNYGTDTFACVYFGNAYTRGAFSNSTTFSLSIISYQGATAIILYEIQGLKFKGAGSGTSITTLYDTFINSVGEITLTNKIEDYDFIMVDFGFNGTDKAHNYIYIPAEDFPNKYPYVSNPNNTNPHIILNPYDDQYARMIMGSANNKLYIFEIGQTVGIYGIYGIKCGGAALDYSTDEQNTGKKWIDGKTIYQKTIILKQNNIENYTYSNNEFLDCLPNDIGDYVNVIQFYSNRGSSDYIDVGITGGEAVFVPNLVTHNIYMTSQHQPTTCIVTIEYTKSTI